MADGEEKSFAATGRRREEARRQGQVARSPELGGALTLVALVVALHALLPGMAGASLINEIRNSFLFGPQETLTFAAAEHLELTALLAIARLVLPALLLAVVLVLGANIGQVGFRITPEALAPQWQRLNPAEGMKRLLSLRGTVELLKGMAKLLLVGGLCAGTIRSAVLSGQLTELMGMPLPQAISIVGDVLWTMGLRVGVVLFLLAIGDYAFQKHQFEKSLRMSASEVKQEHKQLEGDPKTKGRIRKLQREMSRRRMMQHVPKATVVITNPTHFAVALQYEAGMGAPRVVAKGKDEIAQRIKEIAREHHVPLVENKPLAQALHKTVEIGHEIPGDLYESVAQVLAFVYRTHRRRPQQTAPARVQ